MLERGLTENMLFYGFMFQGLQSAPDGNDHVFNDDDENTVCCM